MTHIYRPCQSLLSVNLRPVDVIEAEFLAFGFEKTSFTKIDRPVWKIVLAVKGAVEHPASPHFAQAIP